MNKIAIALILACIMLAQPLLAQRPPLRRIDLPQGTPFLDLQQVWKARQDFPSIRIIPGAAPASPSTGVLYMDSNTGKLYLHRNGSFHLVMTQAEVFAGLMQASEGGVDQGAWSRIDFVSGATVNVTNGVLEVTITGGGGGGGDPTPPGVLAPYAGATAPPGWQLCYGQTLSRTAYAPLFAAIGTTYGAGNGSTTFGLPDLRGRTPFGRDNMGGSAAGRITNSGTGNPGINGQTLGATGGADRYQLTLPQVPSHAHGLKYTLSGLGIGDLEVAVHDGEGGIYQSEAAGSSQAHPQMPPAIICNWLIKE